LFRWLVFCFSFLFSFFHFVFSPLFPLCLRLPFTTLCYWTLGILGVDWGKKNRKYPSNFFALLVFEPYFATKAFVVTVVTERRCFPFLNFWGLESFESGRANRGCGERGTVERDKTRAPSGEQRRTAHATPLLERRLYRIYVI